MKNAYFCITNLISEPNMSNIQLNINLSFDQLIEIVKHLSPIEKMKLNDVIWDDTSEIPVEHQEIVRERASEYRINEKKMLDWDKASSKL